MIQKRKTAMILAAGMGTRLGEFSQQFPKALLILNGKTLLQRQIENLKKFGFNHLIINIHHHADQITSFLKTNHNFNLPIDFSDETDALLDTGGAILKAQQYFEHSEFVMVHNVDILTNLNLNTLANTFTQIDDDALLVCQERQASRKFLLDSSSLLSGWKRVEPYEIIKVEGKEWTSEMAFSGIHFFKPSLFSDCRIEKCSIIHLYLHLAVNHSIRCIETKPNYWFDVGKLQDIKAIEEFLKTTKL